MNIMIDIAFSFEASSKPIFILGHINLNHSISKNKKKAVGIGELKTKKEYESIYDIINIDLSPKYIQQEEYTVKVCAKSPPE